MQVDMAEDIVHCNDCGLWWYFPHTSREAVNREVLRHYREVQV